MVDLVIHKGRRRATIMPESVAGRRWMIANYNQFIMAGNCVNIDVEYIEEMVSTIQADGLDVEVR